MAEAVNRERGWGGSEARRRALEGGEREMHSEGGKGIIREKDQRDEEGKCYNGQTIKPSADFKKGAGGSGQDSPMMSPSLQAQRSSSKSS
eukprot:748443-Hanusia_phi.AAC.5